MPIPYRKTPRASTAQYAAYVEVVWIPSSHTFYGAILVIDTHGQPVEFVHNTLEAPSGFLWPENQVRGVGVASLCHSLFEACTREPELLVCSESLGSVSYCRAEIDAVIPFAQAVDSNDGKEVAWTWINNPPLPSMPAHSLSEVLRTRGFGVEPFERIRRGLRELYPGVKWTEASSDPNQ